MMRWLSRRPSPVSRPEEDAALWLLRMEATELSPQEKIEFEHWLVRDPGNHSAFDRAAAALEAAGRHSAAADIMEMRAAALAGGKRARGAPWAMVASVVGIGVAAMALWVAAQRPSAPWRSDVASASTDVPALASRATHFATAVGERSTISLPDGSSVTLDTQSAIDVEYTPTERGIQLLHGQALFEVAKHQPTPFQVYAAGRRITAVGTTFNVRVDGQRLRVALIEGKLRVAVANPTLLAPAQLGQVTMSPGESLDTAPNRPVAVRVTDVTRTASWREGVAVFADERLTDVVAEMNRYTSNPIVIAEPAVGELRISGVFKTGDPERFATSLGTVFPIAADRNSNGGVVLRSVPASR
jgi:transmembrane sensor